MSLFLRIFLAAVFGLSGVVSRAAEMAERPSPFLLEMRKAALESVYKPMLGWTFARPEMAADYGIAWHRIYRPMMDLYPLLNLDVGVKRFAEIQPRVKNETLRQALQLKILANEVQLARNFDLPLDQAWFAIDVFFRPARLFELAMGGNHAFLFSTFNLSDAFLAEFQDRLVAVAPHSYRKFMETYFPAHDFRRVLHKALGTIPVRGGDIYTKLFGRHLAPSFDERLHFEFEKLPWRFTEQKGLGEAIAYPPEAIVGTYILALDKVERARTSIGQLPSSRLSHAALGVLTESRDQLMAEIMNFPRRYNLFARLVAAETPGALSTTPMLNRRWASHYRAMVSVALSNSRAAACHLDLET